MPNIKKRRLSSFQIIILGFASIIFLGAIILMLPQASASGESIPFTDTIFTSASAVCVTGLVVRDTASTWSPFGQAVILCLIQIGGLGVITIAVSFALLSGRKVSLRERSVMKEAISAPAVGGIVHLTGFILKLTFLFELAGALLMMFPFVGKFGLRGIWLSVFHYISAFCNAGFDILGTQARPYVSLTYYSGNLIINLTIMGLIVLGGLGFLTWEDLVEHRWHFRRYRMQSKVILITSFSLILLPALYFYYGEFNELPETERWLGSLFQSVTTRTAGFNTENLNQMSGPGQAIMILLMLIGGSPGSTAGGMKTTTFAVLLMNARAVFIRRPETRCFGRRLPDDVIKSAATIFVMYLVLFFAGAWLISIKESLPLGVCFYETASAIGTVGLTLGITPSLGLFSRSILIMLMFFGRVGGLTLIYAAGSPDKTFVSRLPQENISVG